MKNFSFLKIAVFCLGALCLNSHRAAAAPLPQQRFVLKEYLGYGWPSTLVHKPLAPKAGDFFANRLVFVAEPGNEPVPFQLTDVTTNPDGSVKQANLWFRCELPSRATKSFLLRGTTAPQNVPASDFWPPSSP